MNKAFIANNLAAISARDIDAGYDKVQILKQAGIEIERGKITSLLGPNGCGKSTMMKVFTNLLNYQQGQVIINGEDIARFSTRQLAMQLSILPQAPITPPNLSVRDLVEQGCYARVGPLGMLKQQDHDAIAQSIEKVGLTRYLNRDVDSLSGGERQRAWIALTLAQNTQILALDEPTTYLDIGHQLEILELIQALNKTEKMTVVMILHDLNHAAQFSDHFVVLNEGKVVASGAPWDVLTVSLLRDVFGVEATIIEDPEHGTPFVMSHRSVLKPE